MARIDNEVIVNARVEKVFKHVENPDNLVEYWPSLIEVSDKKSLPTGGYGSSHQ